MNTPTHIGTARCTRCGGGSSPCPVCRPEPEPPTRRKRVITDEEIQIEMARLRGLFRIEPLRRTNKNRVPAPSGTYLWYCDEHHGGAATWLPIPDYPNDLNAVHRFEAWAFDHLMDSDQWAHYGKLLERTHPQSSLLTQDEVDYHEFAHLCHITARRRCECLLVAISYVKKP